MDPARVLPVELLRRIIELAAVGPNKGWSQKEHLQLLFHSLSLVSHAWGDLSCPFRYSTITIRNESPAKALIWTLNKYPERGALVKAFQAVNSTNGDWTDGLMLCVLEKCSGLNKLELRGLSGAAWRRAWDPLLGESRFHDPQEAGAYLSSH